MAVAVRCWRQRGVGGGAAFVRLLRRRLRESGSAMRQRLTSSPVGQRCGNRRLTPSLVTRPIHMPVVPNVRLIASVLSLIVTFVSLGACGFSDGVTAETAEVAAGVTTKYNIWMVNWGFEPLNCTATFTNCGSLGNCWQCTIQNYTPYTSPVAMFYPNFKSNSKSTAQSYFPGSMHYLQIMSFPISVEHQTHPFWQTIMSTSLTQEGDSFFGGLAVYFGDGLPGSCDMYFRITPV